MLNCRMVKYKVSLLVFIAFCAQNILSQESNQEVDMLNYNWSKLDAIGSPMGRHENAFVLFDNKFYLIGGRKVNTVDVFDPKTKQWENKNKTPFEMHHFQAVVHKDVIYVVGAMTGRYPTEKPLENIWKYYPATDKWEKGAEIPIARRRGSGAAVLFNDKIYFAGGIKYGHTSGTTNYFDSYDLNTGEWAQLTDAPHIRDHFAGIIVDNKLYCIGGRNTSVHYPDNFGAFFNATEAAVDYYDFIENKWFTLKNPLPVPTAAGNVIAINNKVLYFGGEASQALAHNQTQCLDLSTGLWSQLPAMVTGRHGTAAILYRNKVYVSAGSPKKGGGELICVEVFQDK